MATQKQINANRQNAQKSTGPKTDEGKAAVSQNAVKHGLFAQSVIYGENEGDYKAFHGQMFAELDPVGVVELFLAERAANLAWRLKRAERMQNEAIVDMIGRLVTTNHARREREHYYYSQGRRPDEPGMDMDELPLGRIASYDFSRDKVLDRMLMYERRIESSFHKTMRELEKQKMMRQAEQRKISEKQAIAQTEEFTGKKLNLKKQSHFIPDMMGANPIGIDGYGNMPAGGDVENKAKQSQFPDLTPAEGTLKSEKPASSMTG